MKKIPPNPPLIDLTSTRPSASSSKAHPDRTERTNAPFVRTFGNSADKDKSAREGIKSKEEKTRTKAPSRNPPISSAKPASFPPTRNTRRISKTTKEGERHRHHPRLDTSLRHAFTASLSLFFFHKSNHLRFNGKKWKCPRTPTKPPHDRYQFLSFRIERKGTISTSFQVIQLS